MGSAADRDPDETPRISNRNHPAYNHTRTGQALSGTGRPRRAAAPAGHVTDHTTHNRPGAPTMAV
ncbi:hypothetical protein GCM10010425_02710 [Streptomyces spororaveus]|uniref:Uncharacterized protein n=1 Tax=Streptomyces spororaveus TaxID=284039 RepID=A0ABQ3TD01_9ACTN|nr:hypothetical protein Sspor_38500 [Streptomyces spororaveus]